MNYYPFHIGDFRSGTVNMSRLSRWIYRDMLDVYYDTEKPLPSDFELLCDQIGVESDDERRIVERLLRLKFAKSEDGYRNETCDRVIAEYRARAETAKANGKKSAATRYRNGEYMPMAGTLYAVRVDSETVKVGVTANLKSRLHQLRSKYGSQASLLHQVSVGHMGDAEAALLAVYEESRSGEEIPVPNSAQDALTTHMNRISVAYPVASSSQANQEPITNNQKAEEQHIPAPPLRGAAGADAPGLSPEASSSRRQQEPRPVDIVFDHWQSVMGSPRSKLDAKREKVIKSALKAGYSVDDLRKAIDGCALSPFHMGLNDQRTKYNGIDLILRSADQIDKFVGLVDAPPPVTPVPSGGASVSSADWADSTESVTSMAKRHGLEQQNGEHYIWFRLRVIKAHGDEALMERELSAASRRNEGEYERVFKLFFGVAPKPLATGGYEKRPQGVSF
ncbi:YdaU family protein [Cupriavidus sp. DL-D2]|uniref:YdaU family protein n=1 Tax=Cupriavidus sp. DL-D2 TaxID=3144974 RepID=UPI0032132AFA